MNAKQNTKYPKKHQIRNKKTPNTPKNTPNTPKNTNYAKKHQICKKTPNTPKYSKFSFTLFCREKIFVPNSRTFWCTFYRPKKYGGVPKKTNMRYVQVLPLPLSSGGHELLSKLLEYNPDR